MGSIRTLMYVPQPLVVVENINVDQFAAAYGVYAVISGVIAVLLGPFAGILFEINHVGMKKILDKKFLYRQRLHFFEWIAKIKQ